MNIFKKAKTIFAYVDHAGEVSTEKLIERCLGKKKIIVPKVHDRAIHLYELQRAYFVKGAFGIREPHGASKYIQPKKITVALIPGIAFDMAGHRIGFGGGYFDRLLKKVRCTTIGLAYEFQIIDKVKTHQYDVPVDYIVTEKRIIKCK